MAKGGFKGGFGGGINPNMIKTARRRCRGSYKNAAELEEQQYSASAGAGVVTATVNGKRSLSRLKSSRDAVDPEDLEMLEDLIFAAVNEALRKAEESISQTMSKLTGGLNLPF